jgi:hypothetical protein
MSVQTAVLGLASIVLPRRHRARWREEAAAVLMEVSGARRLWYTLDTVVKVPVLARQHRRGQPEGLPVTSRWISAVAGAALLASALAAVLPLLTVESTVESTVPPGSRAVPVLDPLGYLQVMGGLVALVAIRSFTAARRPGGGLRYADSVAVLITVFVGAGPLVAWLLSTGLNLPIVALVGNVLPGLWLAGVCSLAVRRRIGPWPPAVVGTVAGLALMGALGAAPLWRMTSELQSVALLIGHTSLLVAAPTYLIWSAWAGVRLLLGRQDLLIARRPTPAGLRGDAR